MMKIHFVLYVSLEQHQTISVHDAYVWSNPISSLANKVVTLPDWLLCITVFDNIMCNLLQLFFILKQQIP